MALLNNVELPALEDGCVNKKLLVRTHHSSWNTPFDISHQIKADEKTKMFLDAYQAQRMQTNVRRYRTSDLTIPRCSPYGAYMCPGRMTRLICCLGGCTASPSTVSIYRSDPFNL